MNHSVESSAFSNKHKIRIMAKLKRGPKRVQTRTPRKTKEAKLMVDQSQTVASSYAVTCNDELLRERCLQAALSLNAGKLADHIDQAKQIYYFIKWSTTCFDIYPAQTDIAKSVNYGFPDDLKRAEAPSLASDEPEGNHKSKFEEIVM